jgi:branched-chain amino acid transport system ATP-binding protein
MLKAVEVYVSYRKGIDILQGVTVCPLEGRITAVLGANGIGKSTLLKTMFGLLTPHRGEIIYRNENITSLSPHKIMRKGIAYIPQRRNVFPNFSVEKNLQLGGWILNEEKKERKVLENLDRFPILKEKRNIKAGLLSGGQQRMVEIARALMVDPDLLLIDEPTAGLAPKVAKEIYKYLKVLRDDKKTILLVDQNIRQAVEIADYVYILELGRNKMDGPIERFGDLIETFWSHALE